MYKRLKGFSKAVRFYYGQNGLSATIRRSIEVSFDLAFKTAVDFVLLIAGDDFYGSYYFRDSRFLSRLKAENGLKVGIMKIGGLGDALIVTAMVKAIKDKWQHSRISVFVRSESQRRLLSRDKNIDNVVVVSPRLDLSGFLQEKIVGDLANKYFDVFILHRYVAKVHFRMGIYPEMKKRLDDLFDAYNMNFYNFPYFTNSLLIYRKNEYELSSACTDLRIEPSGLSLNLNDEDYKVLRGLPERFITMHHGADTESVYTLQGERKSTLQTKNWFVDRWAQVAAFLKSKGYEILQLGTLSDNEYISGTIDMRGKTTLTEAAAILKKAVIHLDTEGGLVHFARAVGTKSIVLFGPTAIEFYGYKENINLRTDFCKNCWWSK